MVITMLKVRQSWDCLIFNMGIPILVREHFYIVTLPWFGVGAEMKKFVTFRKDKFCNSGGKIAGIKVIFCSSLLHGSWWSSLLKVGLDGQFQTSTVALQFYSWQWNFASEVPCILQPVTQWLAVGQQYLSGQSDLFAQRNRQVARVWGAGHSSRRPFGFQGNAHCRAARWQACMIAGDCLNITLATIWL